MQSRSLRPNMALAMIAFTLLFGVMLACARALQSSDLPDWRAPGAANLAAATSSGPREKGLVIAASTPLPGAALFTPTPDDPHPLPTLRVEAKDYVIQPGDTLGKIAQAHSVSLSQLIAENEITNPDLVEVGRLIRIPAPNPEGVGPNFKIVPDSELVYGPLADRFDLTGFIQQQGGYLADYQEEVEGRNLSGAKVVLKVAQDFSVHPRLLLAILQYQSGWVTKDAPRESSLDYPVGVRDPNRKGLYRQLTWAAMQLNQGFYLWRVNGVAAWLLGDGEVMPVAPTINAGTAGVQQFFALLNTKEEWLQAVSAQGFFAVYEQLFGNPFQYSVEPLRPADLVQPPMQLPFEAGKSWVFTGGPHAGWGAGSAWAALDFAPPGEALGCVQTEEWVVAVADGVITRAKDGAVVQDLDGDGQEGTGWTMLYMHIETRDRVEVGAYVKAGERIGHPSCEGGVSTGTHTHLARRYNGEWISADQPGLAFDLEGWVSSGAGGEYDGYLSLGTQTIEAYAGRSSDNLIQR